MTEQKKGEKFRTEVSKKMAILSEKIFYMQLAGAKFSSVSHTVCMT